MQTFEFGPEAKETVLDSWWTKYEEHIKSEHAYVVGYKNNSSQTYKVSLDFSKSTNMTITYRGEQDGDLKTSKVVPPGECMCTKIVAYDSSRAYKYKEVVDVQSA